MSRLETAKGRGGAGPKMVRVGLMNGIHALPPSPTPWLVVASCESIFPSAFRTVKLRCVHRTVKHSSCPMRPIVVAYLDELWRGLDTGWAFQVLNLEKIFIDYYNIVMVNYYDRILIKIKNILLKDEKFVGNFYASKKTMK